MYEIMILIFDFMTFNSQIITTLHNLKMSWHNLRQYISLIQMIQSW